MATTPREKLATRKETFEAYVADGEIDPDTADAIRTLLAAYDEDEVTASKPEGESYRTPGTLMAWLYRLSVFARGRDLTTATPDDLNQDVQAMYHGSHPAVKDDGLTKGTLRSYQAALRKFYGYHDVGVDPTDIPLYAKQDTSIDPNDMLTREEIHAARDVVDNPRDLLIFDLLLYTGQRREALCTLRLKDVNVQNGTYRLNPEVDGLKGANDRNGNRPLLGAKATVQSWLEYHPNTNNPEHFLITARPNYTVVDPNESVAGETIRRVMADIKADAGITKPMHPHMMRHNFVTIAKRDYDMPNDTIKYLIGHGPDSTVMETTYSHLSGDDHVERAEEAWGIREPADESRLTPDVCRVCSNPLAPDAKACSRCGTVYTPDAKATEEQLAADMKQAYRESDPDDSDTQERIDKLDELLDDPEVKHALLQKLDG